MYLPAHFDCSADARALDALVERDPLVTLVSTHEGAPFATHLPVLARRDAGGLRLVGHWARANPQWTSVAGQTVLAIVHGPHAYVSPRWYPDSRRAVPTWNYAAAHLYGTIRLVTGEAELLALVDTTARRFETGAAPWRLEDTEPETRRMVAAIVGFELTVARIEVKHKLSQNHAAGRVAGAIAGLREEGGAGGAEVADLMAAALAERTPR